MFFVKQGSLLNTINNITSKHGNYYDLIKDCLLNTINNITSKLGTILDRLKIVCLIL